MADRTLHAGLRRIRRRIMMVGSGAAAAWGTTLTILVLLLAIWLDLLWELSPHWRVATVCIAALAGAGWIVRLMATAALAGRDAPVARRLDAAAHSGGQILTGVELDRQAPTAAVAPLTAGLARIAVGRASELACAVPARRAVPFRPFGHAAGALLGVLVAAALLAVWLPDLARTQWQRFTHPLSDVPPFSRTRFDVLPGDVEVLYGSPLEISATTIGDPADHVELVLQDSGQTETLPMFPEPGGRWRTTLARVTVPTLYYVRAFRARSEKFRISVITAPQIEKVRLRITPPRYTGEPPYEGPLPEGGVAGLPGTRVQIWAESNRPLSGGTIAQTTTRGSSSQPPCRETGRKSVVEFEMKPTTSGGCEVVGQFTVCGDGKFELRVIDEDGQLSQQSFGGSITILFDQRPFVRLLQPRDNSLATPTITLPVEISAEDDYGISGLWLYRSLNESRPLPAELPVGEPPPRHGYQQVHLPLADYGVQPGDVIKLFARVEDNDPAGAKGSESAVVTVRIISQEEFERMLRQRRGLEVLTSKYREARRRAEAVAKRIDELRQKLEGQPPEDPIAEKTREELRKLLQQLRSESRRTGELSEHALPYDLDKNLTGQLEALAKTMDEMAETMGTLVDEPNLSSGALARQLAKLAEQLDAGRKRFDREAMVPLEHLEKLLPLIADASRFVILVLRQMDLAERMASLEGHDSEDDPALKVRMRELEEEQREIRTALSDLLDDIDAHLQQVPDDPIYDELRETAAGFVRDVRGSGASEAMAEAETALAEFAGPRAHRKARQAAEILQRFLVLVEGRGVGLGNWACPLSFQPALAECLGDSLGQLLADMGLGRGQSGGFGTGTSGYGYGAQRGGVGLYGALPGIGDAYGDQYSSAQGGAVGTSGAGGAYGHGGRNPDETVPSHAPDATTGGVTEIDVPARYRRRVAEYFQRIAEELSERQEP